MKKRDLLVVGAVLALALVCAAVCRLLAPVAGGEDAVLIYVRGELYGRYPLEERVVDIRQDDGSYNRVHIGPEGVFMEESNCKNHDCIRMGTLTAASSGLDVTGRIVCLPHAVTVELAVAP